MKILNAPNVMFGARLIVKAPDQATGLQARYQLGKLIGWPEAHGKANIQDDCLDLQISGTTRHSIRNFLVLSGPDKREFARKRDELYYEAQNSQKKPRIPAYTPHQNVFAQGAGSREITLTKAEVKGLTPEQAAGKIIAQIKEALLAENYPLWHEVFEHKLPPHIVAIKHNGTEARVKAALDDTGRWQFLQQHSADWMRKQFTSVLSERETRNFYASYLKAQAKSRGVAAPKANSALVSKLAELTSQSMRNAVELVTNPHADAEKLLAKSYIQLGLPKAAIEANAHWPILEQLGINRQHYADMARTESLANIDCALHGNGETLMNGAIDDLLVLNRLEKDLKKRLS